MDIFQSERKKYSKPQIRVVDHSGAVTVYERITRAVPMRNEPKMVKSAGRLI
jgi:hypothetical protein